MTRTAFTGTRAVSAWWSSILPGLIVICGFSCVLPAAQAQKLAPETLKQIEAVFGPWNRTDGPGCAVSLTRQGETIYARGFGMAHLEQPAAITADTIFEAGSVSKQFTASAVVLLALDGRLSLDDPVRKYLPEVPDFGTPITIRHMLNHTSGLRTFRALVALRGRPDGLAVHTNHEILELVERQHDLNFEPGDEYLYCNNGYILSALLVERVTGRSLQDFSQERIFGPLGMKDTQWRDDFTEIVPGRAAGYETGTGGHWHTNQSFTEVYGNGGLLTTVGDLQRFNRELDSPKVLGQELVDMLETPGRLNDGTVSHYALGLELGEYRGIRQISHSGGTAGYRSFLARYPDRDRLSIALLCNDGDLNPVRLSYRVIDVLLGERPESDRPAPLPVPDARPEDLPTAAALEALTGVYRSTAGDATIRVSLADGTLHLGELEARALGGTRFLLDGSRLEVEFRTDHDGSRRLGLADDPKRQYVAIEGEPPSAVELAEYAGSFYSSELEVAYSIYVDDGKLMFEGPFQEPVALRPLYVDTFELPDPLLERLPLRKRFALTVAWVLHFERDRLGRARTLFINEGDRVRRLRFERR